MSIYTSTTEEQKAVLVHRLESIVLKSCDINEFFNEYISVVSFPVEELGKMCYVFYSDDSMETMFLVVYGDNYKYVTKAYKSLEQCTEEWYNS